MRKSRKVILLILLSLLGLVCIFVAWVFLSYPAEYVKRALVWGDSDVYDYQKFPTRHITASPTPFYFEEEPAEAMIQALFEQNPEIRDLDDLLKQTQTQAFIVIQNDVILYEKYLNGASRDTIVTSMSIAKSFTSALIGTAIDDGFIKSVVDPITDYIPELAERDPAFKDITIQNLLRMSSGIDYQREGFLFEGDDSKTYYYSDLRKLALRETTVVDQPGSYFQYNNFHPLLLGMILERTTGMSVTAYLEAKIWHPIGMEFDGSWSLDSETTGFEKMESGINGRAIDFAKFGRLYLNNGAWDGTQILPTDWVVQSTSPNASPEGKDYYRDWGLFTILNGYYGYMWEGIPLDESNYAFFASGHYCQYIYISPQKNLIIIRNGESCGEFKWVGAFNHFASNIELEAVE